ncbi:MAG: glycosyltransferase family 2 protein [Candidatus Zixiibacteriota bacterium]
MDRQIDSLSVIVIAKNEEKNITRCLKSVSFADQLVVVDTGSTDDTMVIAMECGAEVHCLEWTGFGPAKTFALSKATCSWVLSIDADEVVSEELAKEINNLPLEPGVNGYYLSRKTNFLGRWIKHSGWYPNYVPRLFRRDRGKFTEAVVHESIEIDGETRKLNGDFLHYSYPDITSYTAKMEQYSSLGAQRLHERGHKFSPLNVIFNPLGRFFKHYIIKVGFLDGFEGLLIAILSSYSVMLKYLKLRELGRKQNR